MKGSLGLFFGGILTIFLFIFITSLVNQSWFCNIEYSSIINPFDILSFVGTSLVAIWVAYYISKKLSSNRFEVDYLIDDLKSIERRVQKIEETLSNQSCNTVNLSSISSEIDFLYLYFNRLKETMQIIGRECSCINDMKESIHDLYELTTNFDDAEEFKDNLDIISIKRNCNNIVLHGRRVIIHINDN